MVTSFGNSARQTRALGAALLALAGSFAYCASVVPGCDCPHEPWTELADGCPRLLDLLPVFEFLASQGRRDLVFVDDLTDYESAGAPPRPSAADFERLLAAISDGLGVDARPQDEASYDCPDAPVLAPCDVQTGELGVLIFASLENWGWRTAQVSGGYARSRLDGMVFSFILTYEGQSWVIADVIQTAIARSTSPP